LLAARLAAARGKFLLSLNDHPGVRECSVRSDPLDRTTYTIASAHGGASAWVRF
jgi:hypothetical protein